MGQRNSRIGRGSESRGNARDADVGNTVTGEHLDFLTAASEHEWISALQARDTQSLAGKLYQQLVDPVLDGSVSSLFTDENPLGVTARAFQYGIGHEAVIKNDIGLLQQLQSAQ